MKWSIICVGKPSLPWVREGVEDYLSRLRKTQRAECHMVREGPQAKVTQRMLELSQGTHRVILDGKGKAFRSVELARWIQQKDLEACKHVSVMIGGAEGHSEELRRSVAESWSLSNFTLQHELALVVLLEQLYRAYSIVRGEPYHRE